MERSIDPAVNAMLSLVDDISVDLNFANSPLGPLDETDGGRMKARLRATSKLLVENDWPAMANAAAAVCPAEALELQAAAVAAINHPHEHDRLAAAHKSLRIAAYQAFGDNSDADFVGPLMPSEWCKRFGGIGLSTFARWRKNGDLRCRPEGTKRIWIHPDDVKRYEKK